MVDIMLPEADAIVDEALDKLAAQIDAAIADYYEAHPEAPRVAA